MSELRFSEKSLQEVERIKNFYPEGKQKSALLPVLHMAQDEFGGWLECRSNGLCSRFVEYRTDRSI